MDTDERSVESRKIKNLTYVGVGTNLFVALYLLSAPFTIEWISLLAFPLAQVYTAVFLGFLVVTVSITILFLGVKKRSEYIMMISVALIPFLSLFFGLASLFLAGSILRLIGIEI